MKIRCDSCMWYNDPAVWLQATGECRHVNSPAYGKQVDDNLCDWHESRSQPGHYFCKCKP